MSERWPVSVQGTRAPWPDGADARPPLAPAPGGCRPILDQLLLLRTMETAHPGQHADRGDRLNSGRPLAEELPGRGIDFSARGGIRSQALNPISHALVGQRANLPVLATPSDLYAAILKGQTLREELIRRLRPPDGLQGGERRLCAPAIAGDDAGEGGERGGGNGRRRSEPGARGGAGQCLGVEILDRINREKRHNSARNARLFIAARLVQNQDELAAAEDSLRAIQERSRLLTPQQQAEAVITAAAQVEVQLLMREVELGVLGTQLGPDHPDQLALTREVEGLLVRGCARWSRVWPATADSRFRSASTLDSR